MDEKTFFNRIQEDVVNNYMKTRYANTKKYAKNTIGYKMDELMDAFGIGYTDTKKQERFIQKQLDTLEEMYYMILSWEHGEPLKRKTKTLINRFRDFIL